MWHLLKNVCLRCSPPLASHTLLTFAPFFNTRFPAPAVSCCRWHLPLNDHSHCSSVWWFDNNYINIHLCTYIKRSVRKLNIELNLIMNWKKVLKENYFFFIIVSGVQIVQVQVGRRNLLRKWNAENEISWTSQFT